jgi:uncharacterized protein (TIRG00374 family)
VGLGFLSSRWVRLLISIGLLAIVIKLADWRAIWAVLRGVELIWVWAAIALAALDRLLLNYRWQLLLSARGLMLGFLWLLRVQLAANFLGSFLPSSLGLDAVRIAALCRAGLSAPKVVASTLVDRATIVLATLLFGSATVLALAGRRLPGGLGSWILLTTVAVSAACLAVLHPVVRSWIRNRLLALLPARIHSMAIEIASATLAYRHQHRRMAWVAVVTAMMFLVRILFAKTLVLACGANVGIMDLLLVIPILWVVVMLPVTIGGIGLQDAGYVALMALVGVPPAVAVSMSLIEHIVTRLVALPGALFLADVTEVSRQKVD